MTYLLPINLNLNEDYSKKDNNDIAFNSKVSDMLLNLRRIGEEISTTKQIAITAITAITCASITFFPTIKIVALVGSIAISAFSYNNCAKLAEENKCTLLRTMQTIKEIKYLSDPDLIKKSLSSLDSYNSNELLFKEYLDVFEESPSKEKLQEKHEKLLVDQKKINQTLSYFKRDELSCSAKVEESQLDLLLEDLTPLINDINENNSTLKEIQEILISLKDAHSERGRLLLASYTYQDEEIRDKRLIAIKKHCFVSKENETVLNKVAKVLSDQESLSEKLTALQKNSSTFKENETLLNKTANAALKFDQNILNKTRACRNFMFYSLAGIALIKVGLSITILFLGIVAIGYAAKNMYTLISHRNDRAERQETIKTFTKDEKIKLNLLLQPQI